MPGSSLPATARCGRSWCALARWHRTFRSAICGCHRGTYCFFVPAELLVNAQTIVQAEAVDQVDYFHLEFEAHEVILAEGTPAESYVEYDNRHGFNNAHEFVALYPDDTRPSFGYCLPLAEPGMPELTVIRTRLFERAASLGHSVNADPDLHLVIDPTILAA